MYHIYMQGGGQGRRNILYKINRMLFVNQENRTKGLGLCILR